MIEAVRATARRALAGYMRLGETAVARQTYQELASIWHHADPGQGDVGEATAYLHRRR